MGEQNVMRDLVFCSMSVYHSIRGSMQPTTVEDAEDQDGLVVVDLSIDNEPQIPTIHPASDRISGQVSCSIESTQCI